MKRGIFLAVLAGYLLAAPRGEGTREAHLAAATARSLIASGALDIAWDAAGPLTQVHAGRRYALDPPGAALAETPAEAVAMLARAHHLAWAAPLVESAIAALCAALLCALFFGGLRQLGASARLALFSTATLALATALLVHGRIADGTALAALLLYAALRASRIDSMRAALGLGVALAALVVVDPALLPAALVLACATAIRRRDPPRAAAMLGPLFVGVAAVLVHRAHIGRFPEPGGDLFEGLFGLTISTGKSVFLYSPPLLLAAFALPWWWRARRADAAVTLAVAAAVLIAAASLPRWHADPSWGPRRLTPLLPLLGEPIALWLGLRWRGFGRAARAAVLALVIAGVGVQALGLAFSPSTFPRVLTAVRLGTGNTAWFTDPPSDSHFIPQFSPLLGHAWLLSHLVRRDRELARDVPWKLLQQNTPRLDREYAELQLDWWALGAPRRQAAAVLITLWLLAAAGVWLTVRRRVVR